MNLALRLVGVCLLAWLAGCASPVSVTDAEVDDATEHAHEPVAPVPWVAGEPGLWFHKTFPGKRASHYSAAHHEGRHAMAARASSSVSMLRQSVKVAPDDLHLLRFSWKVPALIDTADLSVRGRGDSPVRVVLAFEGDRSKFSMKNAMLSELSQAITGEPLPYATLMYVWSNRSEVGTVIENPRTDRIRKIVLESGPSGLGEWRSYERDIRADFEKAFGEAPGMLLDIGIMTDSDNTQSVAQAWYGPVQLVARSRQPQ